MPQKIPGVWGLAPKMLTHQVPSKKGIQKYILNQLLTKLKTVAVPFMSPYVPALDQQDAADISQVLFRAAKLKEDQLLENQVFGG